MGTIIGAAVLIKGEIVSQEDLRLEGEAEGRLQIDGRLTVGQKGKAHADISAREVVMSGVVEGNIQASDRVELRKSAIVTGDITTQRIAIEEGASLKGKVDTHRAEK